MRNFQIALFIAAALSFIAALFFAGSVIGDILWRSGIAALIFDMVCIQLWPVKEKA